MNGYHARYTDRPANKIDALPLFYVSDIVALMPLMICENALAKIHKAFQILKKLVRDLLAHRVDAGKHRVLQRPRLPFRQR